MIKGLRRVKEFRLVVHGRLELADCATLKLTMPSRERPFPNTEATAIGIGKSPVDSQRKS